MFTNDFEKVYAEASALQRMRDFVREQCGGRGFVEDALRDVRRLDAIRNVLEYDALQALRNGLDSRLSLALAIDGQRLVQRLERSHVEQIRELAATARDRLVQPSAVEQLQAEHLAILRRQRYAREPWYSREGVDLSWLLPRSHWDFLRQHARLVASSVASLTPDKYKPPKSYGDRLKLVLTRTLLRVLSRWLRAMREHVDALRAILLHNNLFGPRFTVSIGQPLG